MNIIDSFRGKYAFLSNFYSCDINLTINGRTYTFPTVENAFQLSKTLNPSEKLIHRFQSITPGQAKKLGRLVKLRNDWDQVKLQVMRKLLIKKFSNPELKNKLLDTGDALLIEGNWWRDTYWGVCNRTDIGDNHLGKLLMEVRDELRTQ